MSAEADPTKLGFDADRLARLQPWMQRWVDQGKFPGAQCVIARHGQRVWSGQAGLMDREAGKAWADDTIVRIYSMTKPVTSVALLMLVEDALCHLDTPLDDILPELADMHVLIPDAERIDQVEPASTRLTMHHLLNHTSGFTYGFNEGLLPQAMNDARVSFSPSRPADGNPMGVGGGRESLADMIKLLSDLPLQFQPGTRWNYGVSTDVLGRVVEVISGKPLDVFFRERILEPLGMHDTAFEVPQTKSDRFASCYVTMPDDPLTLMDPGSTSAFGEGNVSILSGGGGLLAPIADYLKFAEMLRGKGALGDVRLLAPRTVEIMATNSLPGDLASMGQPVFAEVAFDGVGFGLGVSVTVDAGLAKTMSSVGDFGWGGMASTMFWVDPVMDLVAIFYTQLVPSSAYPVRKEFRSMVYSSLTDPRA
ncbi:MAG: serine hydrolase domain-containing protein [Pseudomonadota bacterium]